MIDVKKIFFIIAIIFLASCKTHKNQIIDEYNSLRFYDSTWIYFNLENTTKVKVIDHIKNDILCGMGAVASITLVIDEKGEIFRVLDLCNLSDYKKDEFIILTPETKPNFYVSVPYKVLIDPKTNKKERFYLDKSILKTTYAHIEKINQ